MSGTRVLRHTNVRLTVNDIKQKQNKRLFNFTVDSEFSLENVSWPQSTIVEFVQLIFILKSFPEIPIINVVFSITFLRKIIRKRASGVSSIFFFFEGGISEKF